MARNFHKRKMQFLKTHTAFDGNLSTNSDDLQRQDSQRMENHVSDPLVLNHRSKAPHSLLMQALIEQLCELIEKNPMLSQRLFKEICQKLSNYKFLDIPFIDDLSPTRQQFRKAFIQLVKEVHSEISVSSRRFIPSNGLHMDALLFNTSSNMYCIPSRYKQTFEELEKIGSGGFGIVCKVKHKVDEGIYAVKKICFKYTNDLEFKKVMREATSFAKLKHPNIVTYNQAWIENHIGTGSASSSADGTYSTNSEETMDQIDTKKASRDQDTEDIHEIYPPISMMQISSKIKNLSKESSETTLLNGYQDLTLDDIDVNSKTIKQSTVSVKEIDSENKETTLNACASQVSSYDLSSCILSCTNYFSKDWCNKLKETNFSECKIANTLNIQNHSLSFSAEVGSEINPLSSVPAIMHDALQDLNSQQKLSDTNDIEEGGQDEIVFDCNSSSNDISVPFHNADAYRRRRHSSGATCSSADNQSEDSHDLTSKPNCGSSRRPSVSRHLSYTFEECKALLPKLPDITWDLSNMDIKATLYIQMELCDRSLRDWLDQRNMQASEGIEEKAAMNIFKQVLKGVEHIHSKSIIHRDLKPKNIFFVEPSGIVKIGDFGLATLFQRTEECAYFHRCSCSAGDHSQGIGTAPYAAPEQRNECNYNCKVDIYSLGIILIELLQPLQTAMESSLVIEKILKGNFPPNMVEKWPEYCKLIHNLTNYKPEQRPTAKEILSSSLLQGKQQIIKTLQSKISSMESCLKEQEKQHNELLIEVATLKLLLSEKDAEIARLNRLLSERDNEIMRL